MEIFSQNKKAYFNYRILEELEAGIVLNGQEVKSIKLGRINLKGGYVVFKKTGKKELPEPYLIGVNIPPYQPKNAPKNYEPEKPRKLLFKKSEIKYLIGKITLENLSKKC